MSTHPNAGKTAPQDLLIDVGRLEAAFYQEKPDLNDPNQLVSFGTSGHRGTSSNGTFTEAHILAIAQAICEYRRRQGITGPLFMGKDTHALSSPAERVALEVLAANGIETFIQLDDGFTPTPVISSAILGYKRRLQRFWEMGSSLPHRTTRPRMAASNTIHPMEGPLIPMSPTGFKTVPMNCCVEKIKGFGRLISMLH